MVKVGFAVLVALIMVAKEVPLSLGMALAQKSRQTKTTDPPAIVILNQTGLSPKSVPESTTSVLSFLGKLKDSLSASNINSSSSSSKNILSSLSWPEHFYQAVQSAPIMMASAVQGWSGEVTNDAVAEHRRWIKEHRRHSSPPEVEQGWSWLQSLLFFFFLAVMTSLIVNQMMDSPAVASKATAIQTVAAQQFRQCADTSRQFGISLKARFTRSAGSAPPAHQNQNPSVPGPVVQTSPPAFQGPQPKRVESVVPPKSPPQSAKTARRPTPAAAAAASSPARARTTEQAPLTLSPVRAPTEDEDVAY